MKLGKRISLSWTLLLISGVSLFASGRIFAECPKDVPSPAGDGFASVYYYGSGNTQNDAIVDCNSKLSTIIDTVNTACRGLTPQGLLSSTPLKGCNEFPRYDYFTSTWYAPGATYYECCVAATGLVMRAGQWPFTEVPGSTPTDPTAPVCPAGEVSITNVTTTAFDRYGSADVATISACDAAMSARIQSETATLAQNFPNEPTAHLVVTKKVCEEYTALYPDDNQWRSSGKISTIGCKAGPSPAPTISQTPTQSPSPSAYPTSSPTQSPYPSPTPYPSGSQSSYPTPTPTGYPSPTPS